MRTDAPTSRSLYRVGGRHVTSHGSELAEFHANQIRPRCLCAHPEPEMYVARLGPSFLVKRMPGTAGQHATTCRSYEAPGTDPAYGDSARTRAHRTSRKPRKGPAANQPTSSRNSPSSAGAGPEIHDPVTLKHLLRYLWHQAGLTRWKTSRIGRQSWSTVRRLLIAAADGKAFNGRRLGDTLFLPETFYAVHREAIAARRTARLKHMHACVDQSAAAPLFLLIGEIKRITSVEGRHVAIVKHLPDFPFQLSENACRQWSRHLKVDVSSDTGRGDVVRIAIASFSLDHDGVSTIESLASTAVDKQWIVVDAWKASSNGARPRARWLAGRP